MAGKITFSFGKNWYKFLDTVDEKAINSAVADITRLIPADAITNRNVIDVGSGSGIHSLGLFKSGASRVTSFDYDPFSVEATKRVHKQVGAPGNWEIFQGSVLDKELISRLGQFDIVYSWGVLHHTGQMWQAIENAASLTAQGGIFLISIYQGVKTYERDLALKEKYNAKGKFGKRMMEWKIIRQFMKQRMKQGKNPFGWNEKKERGMTVYHDLVDWLGGLPYEVATDEQIIAFLQPKGFTLEMKDMTEACGVYRFRKTG